MKILLASAEIAPFSKVGGLADVAGTLPKALEQYEVDIRLITPGYGSIDWDQYEIREVATLPVRVGENTFTATIGETTLPESENIPVYFIQNKRLYGRPGVYTDPNNGKAFEDNDDRFLFFMLAILEWLKEEEWTPDILHANDHHTGLLPAYLREMYDTHPRLGSIRSLFTIHNMGYQGLYSPDVLAKTGFPDDFYETREAFRFFDRINFMKVALRYADKINTVSPTYAREIMSGEEFGFGLQDVVKQREKDVSGILNGVDYTEWSPETDSLIPYNYSMKNIIGKVKNRDELLRKNRLIAEHGTPIIGMVSRLVDQKGFDLVDDALEELLSMDLRLIVLGTGERRYHRLLEEAKQAHPDKIGINFTYDNPLAHLIESGSDMFLMPSKYEPCGLNQMYSLKYGTIPIVHATGGLADTIQDYDPSEHSGNGFSFQEYSAEALVETIKRAIKTFRNKAQWKFLRDNAMECDFSWDVSARQYLELYESLMEEKEQTVH